MRTYRPKLASSWWLRKPSYFLYMVRDFTPIPFAIWLLWWLVEIQRVHKGPGPNGYVPHLRTAYILFSAVCLFFALWHSITFLNLSGVVLRIRAADRTVPAAVVKTANYGIWIVASIVIGGLMIYLGQGR